MRADTPDRVRIWLEIAERVEGRARPAPWINDVEGPFDPRPSTFAPPRITARTPQDDDGARLAVMLRNAASPLLRLLRAVSDLPVTWWEDETPAATFCKFCDMGLPYDNSPMVHTGGCPVPAVLSALDDVAALTMDARP